MAEGGGETGSAPGQRVPTGIPPIPLNPDESHLIPLIPADPTYPSESRMSFLPARLALERATSRRERPWREKWGWP